MAELGPEIEVIEVVPEDLPTIPDDKPEVAEPAREDKPELVPA